MSAHGRFPPLLDSVPVPIWCADRDGSWIDVNKAWLDFTGRSLAQEVGRGWIEALHPEDAGEALAFIAKQVGERQPFRLECRLRRHDGQWRRMLWAGVPRHRAAGAFAGFIGACTDLTDVSAPGAQRQREVDETAAVMQELHHRVKNNAQVFASLLGVQASRAADPAVKAALRAAAARASAMAFAQQQIWDAGSSARFDLVALVRRLVRAQPAREVEVAVEAPAFLYVPLATAVPLGLIVHELLTNALSHGYPGGRPGRVCVWLCRDRESILSVAVADDGVGLPVTADLETGQSAGLTIVRSLARQLGATLHADRAQGTKVVVSLSCPAPG